MAGDIADPATADRIVDAALDRFGRIDTLVNNAGVFVSKPFTDYTAEDYALVTGVNLAGFFWLTRRAIAEMASGTAATWSTSRPPSPRSRTPGALGADRADQGRPGRGHQVAGRRVRLARHPGQRRLAGHHPDADAPGRQLRGARRPAAPAGPASARSATWWTPSCSWSHRRTSPARSCTSTAARPPATDPGRMR